MTNKYAKHSVVPACRRCGLVGVQLDDRGFCGSCQHEMREDHMDAPIYTSGEKVRPKLANRGGKSSLPLPTEIASIIGQVEFTVELHNDGILFRPARNVVPDIEVPEWAKPTSATANGRAPALAGRRG